MRDFKIQAGEFVVQRIAGRLTVSRGPVVENITGNQLILALAARADDLERENERLKWVHAIGGPAAEALKLVGDERVRQVAEKGYDAAHDDQHADRSLAEAAARIALAYAGMSNPPTRNSNWWPVSLLQRVVAKYWRDRLRWLVIAAALLVAEIERLLRWQERVSGDASQT